jgi:hypothetical protein
MGREKKETAAMLFHIKQSHAPADCPYGKGGSRSLFDESAEGVTIRGYWLGFSSAHDLPRRRD